MRGCIVVSEEISVQTVNHLGIIAGLIDEIGLVEQIDQFLGKHPKEIVSAGQVVKAMILNGLGFVSAPLYLFERFFEGKATEHLIGQGVRPEHLNDDRLGRVLDQLYLAGLTQLFVSIALKAAAQFGVATNTLHLDSSSFHVHGEYEANATELSVVGEQLNHQLTQLSAQDFRCEADALLAADRFAKKLKYHCLEAVNLTNHSQHKKPGRPRKDAQPQVNYRIEATLSRNSPAIQKAIASSGRFVLATNVTDSTELTAELVLLEYKGQQSPERVRILRFLGSTCGRYYLLC